MDLSDDSDGYNKVTIGTNELDMELLMMNVITLKLKHKKIKQLLIVVNITVRN